MQYARDFRCWVNAGCWTRVSSCKRKKSQRATCESFHWKPKRLGAVLRRRSSEHAQRSVPRRHEPRQQGRLGQLAEKLHVSDNLRKCHEISVAEYPSVVAVKLNIYE